MKKAILLFVAIMVMISFIISAFATGDQLTEDSLIISEETKKEVRSWVDDEYAEVSFRRYYVSLWAGFYSYDNIDDVLADDWCLLGVSYKVVTKSGVKHLSEGVAGILENKSPPNEEAVNAAFTSEVSQYIAPDVIVYNTYYLDNDYILCGKRKYGRSRYPYECDGLVLWASDNGHITANESDLTVFRPSYTDEVP